MRAVVLLSGGLDSMVCALLAARNYQADQVDALNILYGQKHSKESQAAREIADYLGLGSYETVKLAAELFEGAGSTLVDEDKEIPPGPYPEESGPVSTYVPFRNGMLISVATAYALKVNAQAVYFGAHAEDALNWAYPDCTPEFLGAMKNAVWVGTYHKVRLITPLEWLTKAEIVKLGHELGAPFELTWSCYQGGEEACGKCATCISRLEAFKANRLVDPITYRTVDES
ncbi:MAG: 7-cyano-7-deazaguanine synthase QueC [Candidatus Aquicultor sp.]|nr:7-cyano-7-deazaguanine synthase QueC [Candidatus Aquicultor sp.]